MKRVFEETRANTQRIYGPLAALGHAIVVAAYEVNQELRQPFGFEMADGKPASEPQIYLQYELFYFFAHLTVRTAIEQGFTDEQTCKMLEVLGPHLVSTAVNEFFKHWPKDRKEKLRSEFYEKLNAAEFNYRQCHSLASQENPFDVETLCGRLAHNATLVWGRHDDQTLMYPVVLASIRALTKMQLDTLVHNMATVIDSLDDNALANFDWDSV